MSLFEGSPCFEGPTPVGPFVILESKKVTRVIAYIDGNSFYAGITDYLKKHPAALPHNKVDLYSFVQNHLLHEGDALQAVRWYSAIPPENRFDPEHQAKINRHHQYRKDLEKSGVDIRISGFKKRPVKCKHCGKVTKHRKEKESDNRCSLEMIEDAFYNRIDRALLISADSDFVPVLHSLHRYAEYRPVDAVICPPIGRESPAKDIIASCGRLFGTSTRYMRVKWLAGSLFATETD